MPLNPLQSPSWRRGAAFEPCLPSHSLPLPSIPFSFPSPPIVAVNDPPVAVNRNYNTPKNNVLTVAVPGLLAGIIDPDGNALSVVPRGPSALLLGSVNVRPDGSFDYAPFFGVIGQDSFQVRCGDPHYVILFGIPSCLLAHGQGQQCNQERSYSYVVPRSLFEVSVGQHSRNSAQSTGDVVAASMRGF